MQKCFLVCNKTTQIREYLEQRSIVEVVEEHKSLRELDLNHLGIVDVNKFIYIYYQSDDNDLSFRSDLNILRQLLTSAFFSVEEGIFILVDCQNPMLEDFIHSACRNTSLVGTNLTVIHHSGTLMLSHVSNYISGAVVGSQSSSSYKAVYIHEGESDERERYENTSDSLESILLTLTDHYGMYKKRAEVEAISSSRNVVDISERPQILRSFVPLGKPTVKRWHTFLLSGEAYSKFQYGANYLVSHFKNTGYRSLVIDLTTRVVNRVTIEDAKVLRLSALAVKSSFAEQVGYIKCRYNQLGYVLEMLDNIEGVNRYIFVCEAEHYNSLAEYLKPLCEPLYTNFVTHFAEDAVVDYINKGVKSTAVFLSPAVIVESFDVKKFKEEFEGQRVARFNIDADDVDITDFYECATGGGL